MNSIVIDDVTKIGYYVARLFLREKIFSANIYCKHNSINESIMLYMTEIGMLWDESLDREKGFAFYDHVRVTDSDYSVIISDEKSISECQSICADGTIFWLRDIDQEEIDKIKIEPEKFDIDSMPIHLKNADIRKMFLRTFLIAKEEIDIISPWMNFGVVNEAFIRLMESALERGVKIKIIYGLLPSADEFNQARSIKSDKVAERLKTRFAKYGIHFAISRDNIHYKLVLCDSLYKLEGGYNYLSFIGDYSDPDTRKEGSPLGRNVDEIMLLRKEYFEK